jgi:hypothetical protein
MNPSVEQIVPVIVENRRRFQEFCLSLSEEELALPVPDSSWIVKDFASHLDTLDTLFDGFVATLQAGGTVDMTRGADGAAFDLDAWNDAQVAERRNWSIQRIFEEAAANRERLIAAIGGLDDEQISRNMHFSDPKRGAADFPLKAFLVGWAQHDPIHVADMIKALPERAADEAVKSWLANPFVSGYQASMSTAPAS